MSRSRGAGAATHADAEGPARRSPIVGAWDCHVHVFGPESTYPFAKARPYTPPDALPGDLERMVSALGVERFVLVQPSPYGGDNFRLLDGLRRFGERARGVVVLPPNAPDLGLLREWHTLGVRGVRINLASGDALGPRRLQQAFGLALDAASEVGWHIELHVDGSSLSLLPSLVERSTVPFVLDHFGKVRAGTRHEPSDLDVLERLLDSGDVWVKLSGSYRLADQGAGPADVARVAHALVRANPERLVWGSDWPHTGLHGHEARPGAGILPFRKVDPAAQLDLLRLFVPDDATRAQILRDNPQVIYSRAVASRGSTKRP